MSHSRLFGIVTKAKTWSNSLSTLTTASSVGISTRLDSITSPLCARLSPTGAASNRYFGSRYEPPYLDEVNYEPRYDVIQLSLKGHDFPVLEKYRKLALRFAPRFSIAVEDDYPIPTRQTKISHFDPLENGKEGAKVIEEFVLDTFERILMLKDVDAKAFPLFVEFLRNHQPEGVYLSAGLPDPKLEEFRFVPDMEMTVLHRKLEDLDSGKVDSVTWKTKE